MEAVVTVRWGGLFVAFVIGGVLSGPATVAAQEGPPAATHATVPSFGELFKDMGQDVLRLASKGPLLTLAVGGALSALGTTE